MSGRSPQAQSQHDAIVKRAAHYLSQNGFSDIKAHLRGFTRPAKITWTESGKGHIPDVSGRNHVLNIFEVETADSIAEQHTADQWKLFSAYANQHDAVFWVVVPQGHGAEAKKRLSTLGLAGRAKIWEI